MYKQQCSNSRSHFHLVGEAQFVLPEGVEPAPVRLRTGYSIHIQLSYGGIHIPESDCGGPRPRLGVFPYELDRKAEESVKHPGQNT